MLAGSQPAMRPPLLDRVVNLSDGIFAVAITLLVLDLHTPQLSSPTDDELYRALADAAPSAATFVLSFAVVGLYWLSHHRLFHMIKQYDRGLVYVNFVLLATICFIPYPTSVIGHYGQLRTAAVFYAASLALSGLALTLVFVYVASRSSLTDAEHKPVLRYLTLRPIATTLVFLGSIPVAFASPILAELSWALMLPVLFALTRIFGRGVGEDLRPGV